MYKVGTKSMRSTRPYTNPAKIFEEYFRHSNKARFENIHHIGLHSVCTVAPSRTTQKWINKKLGKTVRSPLDMSWNISRHALAWHRENSTRTIASSMRASFSSHGSKRTPTPNHISAAFGSYPIFTNASRWSVQVNPANEKFEYKTIYFFAKLIWILETMQKVVISVPSRMKAESWMYFLLCIFHFTER